MAGDHGVGFLDLPRELRDMVYNYICTDLPQVGDGWGDKHDERRYGHPAATEEQAGALQNCNITRTCRQIHWEFAETLYTQPLQICSSKLEYMTRFTQFIVAASHILPLSLTYGHLVKKVAVLHDTNYSTNPSVEENWRHVVTIVTQLGKLFPKIQTVRVLHRICPRGYGEPAGRPWKTMCGLSGDTREEQVEKSEKFIKGVCWSDGKHVKMPPQLELKHLDFDTILETPLVEAMSNVRVADLNKKGINRKRSE